MPSQKKTSPSLRFLETSTKNTSNTPYHPRDSLQLFVKSCVSRSRCPMLFIPTTKNWPSSPTGCQKPAPHLLVIGECWKSVFFCGERRSRYRSPCFLWKSTQNISNHWKIFETYIEIISMHLQIWKGSGNLKQERRNIYQLFMVGLHMERLNPQHPRKAP